MISDKAVILIDQLYNSLYNFVLPIAIFQLYGTEQLAAYVLAFSVFVAVQSLFRATISVPYTFTMRHLKTRNTQIYECVILVLFFILFFMLLSTALIVTLLLDIVLVHEQLDILWPLIFVVASYLLKDFVRNKLISDEKYAQSLSYTIISITFIYLYMGYVYIDSLSFINFLYAVSLVNFLVSTEYFLLRQKYISLKWIYLKRFLRYNLKFGSWGIGNAICQSSFQQSVIWTLASQSTLYVAIFGALQSLSNAAAPIYQALNYYLGPNIANTVKKSGRKIAIRKVISIMKQLLVFGVIYTGGMYLISEPLLRLIYDEQYSSYASVLSLLALAMSIQSVGFPISRLSNALKRPNVIFYSGFIVLLTIIPGYFIVSQLELVGAGTTYILARASGLAYLIYLLHCYQSVESNQTAS